MFIVSDFNIRDEHIWVVGVRLQALSRKHLYSVCFAFVYTRVRISFKLNFVCVIRFLLKLADYNIYIHIYMLKDILNNIYILIGNAKKYVCGTHTCVHKLMIFYLIKDILKCTSK